MAQTEKLCQSTEILLRIRFHWKNIISNEKWLGTLAPRYLGIVNFVPNIIQLLHKNLS